MTDLDFARQLYGQTLEHHAVHGGLDVILETLGLEPGRGDDGETIARIIARVEEPGFLADLVCTRTEGGVDLLLALLDVGDLHPPRSLAIGLHGEQPADMASLLALLNQIGFVYVKGYSDHDFLMIQPLARLLLADALAEFRGRRAEPPGNEEPPPVQQLIALCLNFIRSRTLRVTARGELHRGDRKKARELLEPFNGHSPGCVIELGVSLLEKLGCVKIVDGLVRVVPARARRVFDGKGDINTWILSEDRWDLPLALYLLDLLHGRDTEGAPWTPLSHLVTRGELFLRASEQGRRDGIERRILAKLMELDMLSLVRASTGEPPLVNYRLAAAGRRLLDGLRGAPRNGDTPVPPSARSRPQSTRVAIFQPSLDVLVPLDAPARVHWRVGSVAVLESVDSMCRYRLEKEHAQCVFAREGRQDDVDGWVESIVECSQHGVPENLLRTLQSWLGGQGSVSVLDGTIIVLDAAATDAGRAALSDAARKLKARQLAPGVYLVKESSRRSRTISVLESSGLRVDCGLPPVAKAGVQGAGVESARVESDGVETIPDAGDASIERLREQLDEVVDVVREFDEAMRVLDEFGPVSFGEVSFEERPHEDGAGSLDDREPIEERAPWITSNGDSRTGITTFLHLAVRRGLPIELVLDRDAHTWPLIPESILKRGSRVYVTGYCPETEELRAFPVDEIVRVRCISSADPR